jgi:hypothetical protein
MARSFNGSSDLITLSGGFVANASAITFSAWFSTSSATSFIDVFSNSSTGDASNTFSVLQVNAAGAGTLGMVWRDPAAVNAIATVGSTANNGAWHHGAGVQTGLSNRVAYLDGIAGTADTTAVVSMAGAIDTARIGCVTRAGASVGFFPGSIADVACWNVALSQAEVAALARGVRPGAIRPANLLGWWPLDSYGHPALDLSAARKNGILAGTTFVIGPPLISATPVFHRSPGAPFDLPIILGKAIPQFTVTRQYVQPISQTL